MSCLLNYNITLSGDCTNTNIGAVDLNIIGSAPPYSITWITPPIGTFLIPLSGTNYNYVGLSAGTYTLTVNDSCIPSPSSSLVSFVISSGTCVGIDNIENTICGFDNGSLTASTSYSYGNCEFYLYEINSGYLTSASTILNTAVFNSLSGGTYYVIGNDGGGCTGKSESCIIKSSTTLDYGFYVINSTDCGVNNGAAYITGLTGNPPYSYLWASPSSTDSYITGLTQGSYGVTVTDSTGCQISKTVFIDNLSTVGLGTYLTLPPTCFSADGELTIDITGGTGPYNYQLLNNGNSFVTFSNSHTFTGLSVGTYDVKVTDAGLCSFTTTIPLLSPNSLTITSVIINNSVCTNNGSIDVNINGSTPGTYVFTLSGGSYNQTYTSSIPNQIFTNLDSGTYTLGIYNVVDPGCVYIGTYTVENTIKFSISAQTTGTTCGVNEDGSVDVTIGTGGTTPFVVSIPTSGTYPIAPPSLPYTYNVGSLASGSYTVTVTDSDGCTQTLPFTIPTSQGVDFILNSVGNSVTAYITQGEPPFTLTWSPNVNGQTGFTVTNLSAGTYSLTVTDDNGCTMTRSVTIIAYTTFGTYRNYNICGGQFVNTGTLGKKGPQQMLLEGFYDLTSGDTNCILNQSIFIAEVTIDGATTTQPFYTGTTLSQYPSDTLWADTIKDIIDNYPGLGETIVNLLNNEVIIVTICGDGNPNLNGANIEVNLIINYDISCEAISLMMKQFQTTTYFDFMDGDPYWFEGI